MGIDVFVGAIGRTAAPREHRRLPHMRYISFSYSDEITKKRERCSRLTQQWSTSGAQRRQVRRTGRACMATAIIVLVSALCGVCFAGIAVAVALVVWPDPKTQTEEV
jgi:hypothetical protein